jgi:hypothetical protein
MAQEPERFGSGTGWHWPNNYFIMMKNSPSTIVGAAYLALAFITPNVRRRCCPGYVTHPGCKPGDASKPVKSLHVRRPIEHGGDGRSACGAKNVYDGVFYSSDPDRAERAVARLQGGQLQDSTIVGLPA